MSTTIVRGISSISKKVVIVVGGGLFHFIPWQKILRYYFTHPISLPGQ